MELLNFKMDVANVLQVKEYDLNDKEKVPIIKTGYAEKGCNLYRFSLMLK